MVDYLTGIITGFCTGLGVALANWVSDRHIKKRLEKIEEKIITLKKR